MDSAAPVRREIVLIGGGHAHVEVVRQFAMRPKSGTRITLISRDVNTPYSGMLPGYLAGHYQFSECHIDLGPLCAGAGARLFHTTAEGLDLEARQVLCANRPPVRFDVLSIDTGSTPDVGSIDGADNAIAIKPVEEFVRGWDAVEAALVPGQAFHLVVVGAGAGGVELSLCLRHRLRSRFQSADSEGLNLRVSVLSELPHILPRHAATVRERLLQALRAANIDVHVGQRVIRISRSEVHCDTGLSLSCDAVVVATHAGAPRWLRESGLMLDEDGFVKVTSALQSCSHDLVFAAGDVAAFDNRDIPKNGVYAVRQGPVLARNLRDAATGLQPRPYIPQSRTLALISTGNKYAVASYGPLAVAGAWVWRAKDFLDRRWMRRYQQFTPMQKGDAPMRCGGCGAKIADGILRSVLSELQNTESEAVRIGLHQPDDAAVLDSPPGKVIVQSVDQFRSFIDDPFVFGRIAANHCLSDIYAMGAEPSAALAMVTLPFAADAVLESELRQLMAGATQALDEVGVALVGGHTAEGSELTLGFSVTGFADHNHLLLKSGLRAGDALILTKPLGTGVILAGHMQARTHSVWLQEAIEVMSQSNAPGAKLLMTNAASACTDVTGFGLLGHLNEMLTASGCHAELDLDALPAISGARELLQQGISSTLAPANASHACRVTNPERLNGASLLYDPQTSGGLLAGVADDRAAPVLDALHLAGFVHAAVIARVTEGAPGTLTLRGA